MNSWCSGFAWHQLACMMRMHAHIRSSTNPKWSGLQEWQRRYSGRLGQYHLMLVRSEARFFVASFAEPVAHETIVCYDWRCTSQQTQSEQEQEDQLVLYVSI